MLGLLGRLLPWLIIFLIWFALNRALDRIDAQKAQAQASKFWKRTFFLWGWIFGTRSWLAYLRYFVTGVGLFFLLRWLAALVSTPVP